MRQWIALLTGAIAWFISVGASFAAAPPACWAHTKLPLFLIPCGAVLATAAAGLVAWRDWAAAGREFPGDSRGRTAASRALASGGVLLNAFFAIVIFAQFVAPAIYGVCQ